MPLQRVMQATLAQVQGLIAGVGPGTRGLHVRHRGTHDGRWWTRQAALVVQQVVTPAEARIAPVAVERLLPVVDQHVRLQLVRVAEPGVAEFTRVRSLAGVHAQVAPQVGDLHELSVAVAAVVRLLARVQSHVGLQVMVARKPLVALWALEGLLPRVRSLVVLQDVFVAEGAVADLAGEDFVLVATRHRGRGRD